ncbi:MAG TPA: hypothetical protein VFP97_12265 [Chitinophagaceae bacterium]|nr:hypothetical protein [Chitinophagaceae bacterium]
MKRKLSSFFAKNPSNEKKSFFRATPTQLLAIMGAAEKPNRCVTITN